MTFAKIKLNLSGLIKINKRWEMKMKNKPQKLSGWVKNYSSNFLVEAEVWKYTHRVIQLIG